MFCAFSALCPKGTFYEVMNGATVCTPCPIGTYNDIENKGQCTQCTGGTTYTTGNDDISDCIRKFFFIAAIGHEDYMQCLNV